ncbi:stromal membrane-associated protein 1-like [Agrilus planipennis]|uniref:Stromal membrane-associated protein 1-like n=1 Tax=Agrilus planipennis TaxID=224129 RepID=A0A1W4WF70_AGRPL|nr:stromal membrane-associated protein 1-like [Agrilus planipennis]
MSTKMERDKQKQLQDKCQSVLNELLRDEDNKYCVDCDAKGPRWASWNLGVFLCIRCAGIHRNLGVHISKVKSVNLDAWTPEQVVSLQQMGNSRARAVYEANLPDNFRRPHSDTSLESFIRAKYEHKKYIAREWVQPPLPKVNWEKEIEEEMERQKRKKKTVVEKKVISIVEVPQIPKPKSSSPKPARTSAGNAIDEKTVQNTNVDLLGTQNSDDNFSNFLSATTNETIKEDQKDQESLKNEEENFFNQITPTEKEKIKLTKDSILALYGSAPPVNPYQNQILYQPQQPFPVGGMPSVAIPNFPGYPQTNMPNGLVQYPAPTGQYQQFPGQLQQYNTSTPFPTAYTANIPAGQFTNGLPPSSSQFANVNNVPVMNVAPLANVNFPNQQQQPAVNPFFVNQANSVQQQFANLSLGNKNGTTPTQVTSNLFQ